MKPSRLFLSCSLILVAAGCFAEDFYKVAEPTCGPAGADTCVQYSQSRNDCYIYPDYIVWANAGSDSVNDPTFKVEKRHGKECSEGPGKSLLQIDHSFLGMIGSVALWHDTKHEPETIGAFNIEKRTAVFSSADDSRIWIKDKKIFFKKAQGQHFVCTTVDFKTGEQKGTDERNCE